MEWLAKLHEAASWKAPVVIVEAVAAEASIPVRDKGKKKIVDHMEEEKSFKFRVDPLVEKSDMAIDAKRQHNDNQNAQRQREKWRMEEIEKELHELKEKLRKEKELRKHEREA